MSMLIKYLIDSKLDVLANALETGLKLKMTLVIGRSGKIGKGWDSIARKIDGGEKHKYAPLFHSVYHMEDYQGCWPMVVEPAMIIIIKSYIQSSRT